MFVSWLRMCPSCPTCGLRFDREPEGGYWIGSYTINLMLTEAVFGVFFVAALLITWPEPPWGALLYSDAILMVVMPFVFFPFTKTLFIAVDLTFRPYEPGDFAEPHELSPAPQRGRR